MNAILLAPNFDRSPDWMRRVERASRHNVRLATDGYVSDLEVHLAVVDDPPPGRLAQLPHLQAVFCLSAGIDALLSDPTFPEVRLIRIIPPAMVSLMCEYVCYHALRIHRGFEAVEALNRTRRWQWLEGATPVAECVVAVLGLGALGAPVARTLQAIGFQTIGWSRRLSRIEGVHCIEGREALNEVLPTVNILVSLLPLTASTKGLLSRDVFNRLPRGASLISVGRGLCVDEGDLLDALEAAHLISATLDVFASEPLPEDHPFWVHPRVTITPHMAAYPRPDSFIEPLAHAIGRLLDGTGELTEHCGRGY